MIHIIQSLSTFGANKLAKAMDPLFSRVKSMLRERLLKSTISRSGNGSSTTLKVAKSVIKIKILSSFGTRRLVWIKMFLTYKVFQELIFIIRFRECLILIWVVNCFVSEGRKFACSHLSLDILLWRLRHSILPNRFKIFF